MVIITAKCKDGNRQIIRIYNILSGVHTSAAAAVPENTFFAGAHFVVTISSTIYNKSIHNTLYQRLMKRHLSVLYVFHLCISLWGRFKMCKLQCMPVNSCWSDLIMSKLLSSYLQTKTADIQPQIVVYNPSTSHGSSKMFARVL